MENLFVSVIGQLLLPVFILMLFVGIAGGRPETVLNGVFSVVGAVIGGLFQCLVALVRAFTNNPSPRQGQRRRGRPRY